MRSSLIFLLNGILFSGILWAEEFIISYKAKMENELLIGEEYKVSKALSLKGENGLKTGEFKMLKVCEIFALENQTLEENLKIQKEQILECLYSSGVSVEDRAMSKNGEVRSRTIFKIPPKRVIAVPDNGVIKISILEKK